ncbi:MAG TPA: HAD-IC family P-type ATPase [Chthoniobacterales bacterium]
MAATTAWHHLHIKEVVELLKTDLSVGLSAAEVQRRLREHGPNRLTTKSDTPAWKRFLLQLHQPLVYVLIGATTLSAYLGQYVDALVIFAVVVFNGIVGYLQEAKAEKAISALTKMMVAETTVRRDGRKQRVGATELVPGDIVLLESGNRVPADLRLFQIRGLQIDESPLTGESQPVYKHAAPLTVDTVLADRKSLAFAGTAVASGRGEGVVWATGDKTEVGRIAWLITEAVDLVTPLTRKIAQLSRMLLWLILALAFLTAAVGLWHGQTLRDMFMAAVAMAVGAIPEGLPAAVTVTLAIGVSRMARRRAIIRKLPAVETLGSTTVICSDKTGTLTENQMTVQEIYAGGELYEVTGAGYEPTGAIQHSGKKIVVANKSALSVCLRAGLLCNDAILIRENGETRVQGDPTEAALIVAAEKAGMLHGDIHPELSRLDAIPFESEHQFMATLHRGKEGHIIYKKGAMERVVGRCSTMLDAAGTEIPIDRETIQAAAEQMAAKGLRVLAFAQRNVPTDLRELAHQHVERDLTFLGLQGMMDPPRPEARPAVLRCQNAGIAVKMITGDHILTARAVAQQIGIDGAHGADSPLAMTGRELDQVSDDRLPSIAEQTAVFARVTPEQKLRLVQALQARGHIVAMTGDGVNDAPALKQADIGIAMGIGGTDVARGAADMVLTDDNFASIEAAVEEGRGIFDNLRKFIVWTLPTNAGEALILLTAIFLGIALPVLPLQLLWINITEPLFGLTLVFEPKERGLMERPPRDPRQPILTFPLLMRSAFVAIIMLAGAFGLFLWELHVEKGTLAEARTVVVNVIVLVEGFYLLNCRSLTRSTLSVGLFSNLWLVAALVAMIIAQLFFTYAPIMNRLFHSAPISLEAWLRITAIGIATYLALGFEKWLRFGRKTRTRQRAPTARTFSFWRRLAVTILGFGTLLAGIVMLVFPGPAIVFIPLGLSILATEFAWARNWLSRTRQFVRHRFKIELKTKEP